MQSILDKLSNHLKNTIAGSISLAGSMDHLEVAPLHFFYSLLEEQGSVGAEILSRFSINKKYVLEMLSSFSRTEGKHHSETIVLPGLNDQAKRILEKSMLLAYEKGCNYVGTEHLLFGLLKLKDEHIEHIWKKFSIEKNQLLNQTESVIENTNNFPDIDEILESMEQPPDENFDIMPPPPQMMPGRIKIGKKIKTSVLENFTVNLTDKTIQKKIDPVIGRGKEIERVVNILSRRNKNNPILIGEPGVGKTAIVEGLAKKIVEGNVPAILKNKKIFALDMALLLAGTIYRGEFEARLKQIIDEVKANPDFILFIDEIHNIISAGSNTGTMDAANILKPALARGELRCIGATTIDEYKKYFSNDPALQRRFGQIEIEEPSQEEAIKILKGLKKHYDEFHHTKITDKAIETAVELGVKYIHDNFLPDKAIDLIDEAAASVVAKRKQARADEIIEKIEDQLESCQIKKEKAIKNEKFNIAKELKRLEGNIERNLKEAKKYKEQMKPVPRKTVTEKDIARVLSNKLDIDERLLLQSDLQQLNTLAQRIKKDIVGQNQAIEKIIQTLRKSYLGLGGENKPFASLLFVGPSGVGKTELAKVLARKLYHNDKSLIRLDMSEFAEAHGISKLLGSPAGYVGHKERNHFVDKVKKHPYSIILFDEIDKAHADVVKLLLQILDEGKLTDSRGKEIYFHHATIILTTNVGAELFKSAGIGFGDAKSEPEISKLEKIIFDHLKQELGTAVIGRINSLCVFPPLQEKHLEKIVELKIARLNAQLAKQNLKVIPEKNTLKKLVAQSSDKDAGARDIEEVVTKIMSELVAEILQKNRRKKNYILRREQKSFKLV